MSSDDPILLGDSDEEGQAGRPVEIPSSPSSLSSAEGQDVNSSSHLPTNELERRRAIFAALERNPAYQAIHVEPLEDDGRGRTAEEAVEIDSDIGTVGTIVEVSDKDVEPIYIFDSSEEEDSDDEISLSSTDLRQRDEDLKKRAMPYRGDRSFMLKTKGAKVKSKTDIEWEVDNETRPYMSIGQEANKFKKEYGKEDDNYILLVDEIIRRVREASINKRAEVRRTKASILWDLRKKKRKQLKSKVKAQKELPIPASEEPHHFRGDYLDDIWYMTPNEGRRTFRMKDGMVGGSVEHDDPSDKYEKRGGYWASYKRELQQYRPTAPRYIIEPRLDEAEEVIRLLRTNPTLLDPTVPQYARTYIAILTKLSKQTIDQILKDQLENETSGDADTLLRKIPSKLFCPRCQIFGCTIHGLVDIKNYSHQTAVEVAMKKEESEFWKQEQQCGSLVCVPTDKTSRIASSDHVPVALARSLCFIYQADLNKVSRVLGASERKIMKAIGPEGNLSGTTMYRHLKGIKKKDLKRFHGLAANKKADKGQTYFTPYKIKGKKSEAKAVDDGEGYVPCIHTGPCSKDKCPCMKKKYACTNHCILGPLSLNFFPGCRCESGCLTDRCPCNAGGRECDPDFCKKCQTCTVPMGAPVNYKKQKWCKNDNVRMHRQRKGLYVDKSTIPEANWGLFCKHDIQRGNYIGEYVGELIDKEEAERRTDEEEGAYLFELSEKMFVDAIRVGNLTRYMNHDDGKKMNVRAMIRNVDGDPRISFGARVDIPAGTELFFDYGKWYKWYKTDSGAQKVNQSNSEQVDV